MGRFFHPRVWKNVALQQKYLPQVSSRESATATAIGIDCFPAAKPVEQIPGYRPLPFVGTSWVFWPIVGKYQHQQADISDTDKYLKFGNIVRDVYAGNNIVHLYDAKDIETLLRHVEKYPSRGILESMAAYRNLRKEWFKTLGVILTEGQEWYDLRFKLQKHLMKPRAVDPCVERIVEVTEDLMKLFIHKRDKNGEVADFNEDMFKWSLESIYNAALNSRLGCLDINAPSDSNGQKFIKAVLTNFHLIYRMESIMGNSIQLWKYFPTPTWRKFVEVSDFYSEFAYRQIKEAIENRKTKSDENSHFSIVETMLTSKDVKPYEIMTMVIDLLLTAVDTTSNSLSFLTYHLAKNPDKQEKLYREILKFLPSSSDKITAEKLSEMRYLKLCLKEALRLHPVVRIVPRVTEKDLVLSGYDIPAGTMVFCHTLVCGRLEKYFEKADQFIPERWDDRGNRPSPFASLPFGFGTRSCIGKRLAELKVLTAAAEIIRRFKVEYHYEEFGLINRMLNTPDRPLKFRLLDRVL